MEISENFNTDPSSRGWLHEGLSTDLDWDAVKLSIGGLFDRQPNESDRYVKHLSAPLTQNNDIQWSGNVKIQITSLIADYPRVYFGLANSNFLNANGAKNKIALCLHHKSTQIFGFYAAVIDSTGTQHFSASSIAQISTISITDWYFEAEYKGYTKKLSIKLYDNTHTYLETINLTLPGGTTFNVDEIGVFNRENGSMNQKGWWDNLVFQSFPLFTGEQFKMLVDGTEFPNWSSFNFGGSKGSLRGLGINIPNPRGKHTGRFHVNQEIEIQYKGVNEPAYRTVYKGFMDHPTSSVQGKNGQIVLSGRDAGVPLTDEKCVDATFTPYLSLTGVDPFDIATYIVSNLKTSLEIAPGSQRNEVPIPIDYDFNRKTWCVDVVKKMAEYGNYEWFITMGGKFLMRPPKELIADNISKVYILGTKADFVGSLPNDNVGYILTENVGEDGTDIVNMMGLQGKDKFVYHMDGASVAAHRLRHDYIEDDGLASDQLQQIVIAMVNNRKLSRKNFSMRVKGTFEIDRGDIVWIDDKSYGFSGQPGKLYRIVGKTDNISKNGFFSTLQLSDTPLKVSVVMDLFQ